MRISITIPELKGILIQEGINHLYHANTVVTSLTFLQQGGLLSRGAVEDMRLRQTPQQSDQKDREWGIFYDIFFDTVDVHARAKKVNHYGPVTFEYSIDVLDTMLNDVVKVTRKNPIYWNKGADKNEYYFSNKNPMRGEFTKGSFGQHLTICDRHGPLPFKPFLTRVLIENPRTDDIALFEEACDAIQILLEEKALPMLQVRDCPDDCGCFLKYAESARGYTYHRFRTK